MGSIIARISTGRAWLIPTSLLLLSAVPVIGGLVRVTSLGIGVEVTPANARFFASPVPVTLHVVGVTLFVVLGAFQFAQGFRRRRPRWHRLVGVLLVPSGLVVALTGLWMEAFYELPAHDGPLLSVFRVVFGTAMIAAILLGVQALVQRDYARHGAWMMRSYAIALGAGTQVVLSVAWIILYGEPSVHQRAVLMGAGWIVNVVFAEWVLRRKSSRRTSGTSARGSRFQSPATEEL